ncbi:MAG: CocE/NonD family hydrolase [Promethearchaeota archaeon]|nr:MAG: CocE/NonD family hydrolase [Candidatus Lokiarchaeota archaeon]
MINWLIAIFYLFIVEYTSLNQILLINLPLVIVSRVIYLVLYLYRIKDLLKAREEEVTGYSPNKFKIYLFLKHFTIIIFSILYFPFALAVTIYSLMLIGDHIKRLGIKKAMRILTLSGNVIKTLLPFIGIVYFVFDQDYLAITSIAMSFLFYIVFRLKERDFSIDTLKKQFVNRWLYRTKVGKILTLFFLGFTIVFSLFIITGVGFFKVPSREPFFVEMRDETLLATDVYFSPGSLGTPKPVILVRTPYGKTGFAYDLFSAFYFTQDYHLVIQDMRGTGLSGGGQKFLLFTKSYQDGVDTIKWIMKQPWCNGKIGSVGVSALAINQYFFAGMNPEGLLAQSLWFGTPELFDHAIYQGAYHKSSVENWIESTAPNNYDFQINKIFEYFPKNITMYNSTSLSIPIGPTYANISVAGLHVGGWYDHFLQGTIDGYIGYDDEGGTQAKGRQKLIMGPWTHGNVFGGKQGQLVYPENSNGFDLIFGWEQEIFDEALRGIPANWDGARVAYYQMGSLDTKSDDWNYWRYAYDWPLDHVNHTWHFTKDGSLLKYTLPSENYNFSYLYDPRDPVDTLGGQNQPFDLNGPYDQRPVEQNRSDVLLFETESLTNPVEIVGRILGDLYVTSNCTDTDFTMKLTDVYPDGRSMLITDGCFTMRSREGYDKVVLMSGNTTDVYRIFIDCWTTAYTFASGHKIRVAISSSNYPRYAKNPNTGAPLAEDYLKYNIANNTLLTGPAYKSGIILPQIVNMSLTHTIY